MEQIIRSLLRNRDELWKVGVEIPAPSRYRGVFTEAATALKEGPASREMQEMLLDAAMDSDHAARVVLCQPGFIGLPRRALTSNGLYPFAHKRLLGLSNLFPESEVEFFLGIQHPARQVQHLLSVQKRSYESVMQGIHPLQLRWAPLFQRIVEAVPGRRIVTWAQEDLPFTWPELLRRMAGVPQAMPLLDEDTILADILTPDALSELRTRIQGQPGLDIGGRRDLVEQALAQADPARMEADVEVPGWSQGLIDQLSEVYAADLAEIAALSGVEFIAA